MLQINIKSNYNYFYDFLSLKLDSMNTFVSIGKGKNFEIGRLSSPLAVLSLTTRTILSFPGIVSIMRALAHFKGEDYLRE